MAHPVFSEPYSVSETSRGVFLLPYKPKAKSKRVQDPTSTAAVRKQLFTDAWGRCSDRIHTTLSGLHDTSLSKIVEFVDNSPEAANSLVATLLGRPLLRTGLIIGAQPGSSSGLFDSLCRQLSSSNDQTRTPCRVSRISSRSCGNVKAAMRSIINGFVESGEAFDDDDEDDEGEPLPSSSKGGSSLKSANLAPEDMYNLCAWYSNYCTKLFLRDEAAPDPQLVILLEDLESVDAQVLDTVLNICAEYRPTIPMVFLIGVATSTNALSSAVPRTTQNLLDTENFFVEPGKKAFCALMDGLFLQEWDAPIFLGPKVYAHILETFEDLNHSIDATISSIQYIYMRHFAEELSILTLPLALDHDNISDEMDTSSDNAVITRNWLKNRLSPQMIDELRQLPSFVRYAFSNPDSAPRFANDDSEGTRTDKLLDFVEVARGLKNEWARNIRAGMIIVSRMMSIWNKRTAEEVLLAMVLESKGDDGLEDLIDDLSRAVLNSDLAKCSTFAAALRDDLAPLVAVDISLLPLSMEISDASIKLQALKDKPRTAGRHNLINSNAEFQVHGGTVLSAEDKEFSSLVKNLAVSLQTALKNLFSPFSKLPLHEIWFPNSAKPLAHFHPSILPSYQRSLAEVTTQPRSSGSQADGTDAAQIAELDVRIAYRLYRETGKTINLHDWFQAFDQASYDQKELPLVEGEDEERREKRRKRIKEARFIRALGDLAHVGFVLPSSRKAEHVSKSVF